jgi:3-methylcrotonyl-CoA carboxylase alpha subunit
MMQSQVAGTVSNRDFLKWLAGDCDFVEGRVDTGLIARVMNDLHYAPAATPEVVALATISALGLQNAATAHQGFALWSRFRRFVQLPQGDKVWTVCLQINGPRAITVDLGEEQVTLMRDSEGHWRAGGARIGEAVALGESVTVFASHAYNFAINDPLNRASDGADESHLVVAPMPGVVSGVLVKAGDPVSAGMRMALLEAMKMEHTLCAPRDGVVADVLVCEGDQIEAGVAMIRLEESEEDAA